MQINQANLGSTGQLGVSANITTAATGAFLKTAINAAGGAAASAVGTTAAFAGGGTITLTAPTTGTQYNGVHLILETNASTPQNAPSVTYNSAAKQLIVQINSTATTTLGAITNAIGTQTNFTATATNNALVVSPLAGGDFGAVGGAGLTLDTIAAGLVNGTNTGGGLSNTAGVQFQLAGSTGSQVFSFAQGATASTMATQINLSTSQTGVFAQAVGNTLQLSSTNPLNGAATAGYGSNAKVQVTVLSGGFDAAVQNASNATASLSNGTDAVGTINGATATGSGNTIAVDSAALSMSMTVAPTTTGNLAFNITGGGAVFQIGPTVGSSQQAHLGIGNMNAVNLGGADGSLYNLYSNGSAALETNPTTAAAIVTEAANQVTSLRGELGAFQSASLDSNINSLNAAVTNLTSAKSSIQDTDFAAESAALTQAQVLVQSGTAVLSIANHAPANVLTLLQGAAQV